MLITLTGVVSGVASTAASGGDELLLLVLLLLGVEGVERCSCPVADNGGGLCGCTAILGDQKVSSSPLLALVADKPPEPLTGVYVYWCSIIGVARGLFDPNNSSLLRSTAKRPHSATTSWCSIFFHLAALVSWSLEAVTSSGCIRTDSSIGLIVCVKVVIWSRCVYWSLR